jgi:hypothetical protein
MILIYHQQYIESGISVSNNTGDILISYITSILYNGNQLITSPLTLNQVSSYINSSTIGDIYIITYTVVDSIGNYSSINRTITIVDLPPFIYLYIINLNITYTSNVNTPFQYNNNLLIQIGNNSAWSIKPSLLIPYGFSYNSTWSFLFNLIPGDCLIQIHFDDTLSNWGTPGSCNIPPDRIGVRLQIGISPSVNNFNVITYPYTISDSNLLSMFNTGLYFLLTRDNLGYINIYIYNMSQIIIYQYKSTNPYNYIYMVSPFSIVSGFNKPVNFIKGVMFNNNSTLSLNSWINNINLY